MEKKTVISFLLAVLFILLIAGCGTGPQKYMLSKDDAQQERAKQQTGLANPASMHCQNESGNTWQIREDSSGGQYGVCIFSDGSWCEEWAYYKEQCERGTNITSCAGQYATKSVCPPEYSPVCAKIENNATKMVRWKSFSNACMACIGSDGDDIVLGYNIGQCKS